MFNNVHCEFLILILTISGGIVLSAQVYVVQHTIPVSTKIIVQNASQPQIRGNNCLPHDYDIPQSHSVFYGCRNKTDRLLFNTNVLKAARFWSTREKYIDYPGDVPVGHVRNDTITAIWCYDLTGYKKGGICSIISGGVNQQRVRLHIRQTSRNTPLAFKVEIYGRPEVAGGNKVSYGRR